jgi:hypothetical protein
MPLNPDDYTEYTVTVARYKEMARAERECEILTAELAMERARSHSLGRLLIGIHSLMYPPRVAVNGRTMSFRPADPDPHELMQALSDRIRALPDEIAAIDTARTAPDAGEGRG